MELSEFKEQLGKLLENEIPQQVLEEFIGEYFSHKPILYYHIEAGKFVARSRYNKNGAIVYNQSQLSYNCEFSKVVL